MRGIALSRGEVRRLERGSQWLLVRPSVGRMGELERSIGRCPLAREGEWLAVLERWAPVRGRGDERWAYEARCATEADWRAQRWRSAASMPHGASRWFVEVYRVELGRLHGLNTLQVVGSGVRCPAHDTASSYCQAECDVRRGAFRERWSKAYRDRARGWAANPWVWLLSVRRHGSAAALAAVQRSAAS